MGVKGAQWRLKARKGKGDCNECLVDGTASRRGRVEELVGWCRNASEQPGEILQRAGDNGVRDTRRGIGRHRDTCDHRLQAEVAGALECDIRRDKQPVAQRRTRGQSTVEFAIVTAAFLVATVALSAMWHVLADGVVVEHAAAVASHHIQATAPTTVADIFLY